MPREAVWQVLSLVPTLLKCLWTTCVLFDVFMIHSDCKVYGIRQMFDKAKNVIGITQPDLKMGANKKSSLLGSDSTSHRRSSSPFAERTRAALWPQCCQQVRPSHYPGFCRTTWRQLLMLERCLTCDLPPSLSLPC